MGELWPEVRALLSQPPSTEVWSSLVRHLSHRSTDDLELAVSYIASHITDWPASLRTVSSLDAPDWHCQLADHLSLAWKGVDGRYGTDLPSKIASFSHVEQMTLTDDMVLEDLLRSTAPLALRRLQLNAIALDVKGPDILAKMGLRLPSLDELILCNVWADEKVSLRSLQGLRSLRLVGGGYLDYCPLGLPLGLLHLEWSGFLLCDCLIETILANEGAMASVEQLSLRAGHITGQLVSFLSHLPALRRLDLRYCTLEESVVAQLISSGLCKRLEQVRLGGCALEAEELAALAPFSAVELACPTLDAIAPQSGTSGHYSYRVGGSYGGESARLSLTREDSLSFALEWSGHWSSEYAADSDSYGLEGRILPLSSTCLLLIPEAEDGHLAIGDPTDNCWPYLVGSWESGWELLHDLAPPNGNYEGPFAGFLARDDAAGEP